MISTVFKAISLSVARPTIHSVLLSLISIFRSCNFWKHEQVFLPKDNTFICLCILHWQSLLCSAVVVVFLCSEDLLLLNLLAD